MGGLKTISIIVAANIKGLEAGLGKANKSLGGFAASAARIGSTLTFGITAPLTALGNAAFDTFSEFENSMTKVMTVTNATADEFKMLTDEAKRLGSTTQFTARQVSDLQLVLGRKGFSPKAIVGMEEAILDLALATGEDLSLAAETVSSSINAFNLEAKDSNRVANTLASAAANSSMQLSTFATAFGHAGASANAVGVEVEELSAMMGVLMDNGIKASKAGTGLRRVFMDLHEKGIPFNETLHAMADGTMDLEQAQELVGRTAANQLLILSQNLDKITELTTEYETNTGRLKEMAKAMGATTFAKVMKFKSAIEGLRIELGATIAKVFLPLIEFVTGLASKFKTLDDRTKKIIVVIGTLLSLIGPLVLLIGGLGGVIATGVAALAPFLVALGVFAIKLAAILILIDLIVKAFSTLAYFADVNRKAITERLKNTANSVANFFIRTFNDTVTLLRDMAALWGIKIFESFTPAKEFEIIPDKELTKIVSLGDSFDKANVKYKKLKNTLKDGLKGLFSFNLGGDKEEDVGLKDLEAQMDELEDLYIEAEEDSDLIDSIIEKSKQARLETERWQNATKALGLTISESFSNAFSDLLVSGEHLGRGLENIFIDIAKMLAQLVIKAAVLAAIFSLFPTLGGIGPKKATGFKDILTTLMGGKYANGGRPPLGKMSLVGERGPELFVPDTAGTIIPNHALGGGTVIPDVRISGDDLLIVFDRASRRKNRR